MMTKVVYGGLIGAVIAFVWMMISWMVLPWHSHTTNTFSHEDFVGWVIKENAPKDGVYIIPSMAFAEGQTKKEREKAREKQSEALKKGPFIYAEVKREGMNPMNPRLYIVSFFTQFIGAAFVSFLLLQLKETSGYLKRFFCIFLFGLAIAVLAVTPQWNWFAMETKYALVMMADYLIAWTLIGLVLPGIVRRKKAMEKMM